MAEKKKELDAYTKGRVENLPAAGTVRVSSVQNSEKTNNYKLERNPGGKVSSARRESYLCADVASLLIRQIGLELNNQYLYHNFGIWYDINSLFGQAEYCYHRAQEEHDHAQ